MLRETLRNCKRSQAISGGGEKGQHSVKVIDHVKKIMKSVSGNLQNTQNHYQDGKSDEAGKALKAIIGDSDSFVQASKEMKQINGLENRVSVESGDISEIVNIEDISDSMFGEQIQPQIFDDVVKLSKEFTESLEDIDLSQYAEASSMKKPNDALVSEI